MKHYDFICPRCGRFTEWSYSEICGPCVAEKMEEERAAHAELRKRLDAELESAPKTCCVCGCELPPYDPEFPIGWGMDSHYYIPHVRYCWRHVPDDDHPLGLNDRE